MVAGTDVEVTSAVNIFVKDSGLVRRRGRVLRRRACPCSKIANERFRRAAEAGLGQRDDSRVIETWDRPGLDLV